MKMAKLSQFEPSEIFRLTSYLEKFAKDETDKKVFVLNHLKNFFPNLTFEQNVLLQNIINADDHDALKTFIEENPDIDVNLDGDSVIKSDLKDSISAKEMSLRMSYATLCNLKSISSRQRQMKNAFDLIPLKDVKFLETDNYELLKHVILSLYPEYKQNIQKYENIEDDCIKPFLSKVFKYCIENHVDVFIKYVFYYLDVLRLNFESELSKDYLKNIKEVL